MTTPDAHIPGRSQADAVMIELMFKYAVLMEYQLLDLQESVRNFVSEMNAALMKLDQQVTEEGMQAQALYEAVFSQTQGESQVLNERAAARVDDIISEALMTAEGANISEDLVASMAEPSTSTQVMGSGESNEARDAVWSKISKKLESITRLEERLRPQVYKLVQCLNFEDIQSQRLDHLLSGYKLLNEGLMRFMQTGQTVGGSPNSYAQEFLKKIRSQYTMEEERKIFDRVFSRKV